MDRAEFRSIVEPLVLAMRADFDAPSYVAYYRVLEDVPAPLLRETVERVMREPREFFPKAGELLASCEQVRRDLIVQHPWDGCVDCADSKGWREIKDDRGDMRVQRCPCRDRYAMKLEQLGLTTKAIAQLPQASTELDPPMDPPRLEVLPVEIRERVQTMADRKVMR